MWFKKKTPANVDETDVYKWPLNKYPKWLLDVINKNTREDFAAAYKTDKPRKWYDGKPITWEEVPWNWRQIFRERVILDVFPVIVREMNKPYWDTAWIKEYEEWMTER